MEPIDRAALRALAERQRGVVGETRLALTAGDVLRILDALDAAERKLDQARATLRAAANRARGIAQSAADDEAALAVLGPLVAELRALRAVRDAAEAFLSPPTLHAIGDARERLRAALDAAKAGG